MTRDATSSTSPFRASLNPKIGGVISSILGGDRLGSFVPIRRVCLARKPGGSRDEPEKNNTPYPGAGFGRTGERLLQGLTGRPTAILGGGRKRWYRTVQAVSDSPK